MIYRSDLAFVSEKIWIGLGCYRRTVIFLVSSHNL